MRQERKGEGKGAAIVPKSKGRWLLARQEGVADADPSLSWDLSVPICLGLLFVVETFVH